VEVVLDRTRRTRTDADGRFSFDAVEAGVRGLAISRRLAGVRVRPGRTTEAVIGPGLEAVRVDLRSGDEPWSPEGRTMGVLLGLGDVFTLHGARIAAGSGSLEAKGVLPGRYLFLASGGLVARVTVDGTDAVAELGTADLTVTGTPGTRVYVLPEDVADDFGRLMAGRVGSRSIPEDGAVRFAPLPAGSYVVGIDRQRVRAIVEVTGPGCRVDLR
jgi:hypothetical protein